MTKSCEKKVAKCCEKKNGLFSRLFRRRVQPVDAEAAEARRQNLSNSYVEHHLTLDELSEIYSNSFIDVDDPEESDGLDTTEAMKRLRDGGRNVIQTPKEFSNFQLFAKQFLHKFWLLLLTAAALSIISYFIHLYRGNDETTNLYCAFTLISVVMIMCILSYRQEKKAMQVVGDFHNVMAQNSFVIRDCKERQIPAEELVVGDLVIIRCGQRVPADARILQSNGLKLEISFITGDTTSQDYTHEAAASHVSVFDARNIAFKGSYCTEGDGVAVVIRTGEFTMIGEAAIIQSTGRRRPTESQLSRELNKFVHLWSIVAIVSGLLFFITGTVISGGQHLLGNFMTGFIIVIVANIPQGLPATVMSQLAIIAQRMSKKHVYIKNLDVVDELGAATVIATDKTGTLTENVMITTDLWYNRRHHMVDRFVKHAHLRAIKMTAKKELEKTLPDLLTVMAACNSASVGTRKFVRRVSTKRDINKMTRDRQSRPPITKKFTVIDKFGREVVRQPTNSESCASFDGSSMYTESTAGDEEEEIGATAANANDFIGPPPDVALLRYVENMACVEGIRQRFHHVLEVPFNSVRRWQLVVAHCLATNQVTGLPPVGEEEPKDTKQWTYVVMMKGAPEVILNRCTQVMINGELREIDDDFRRHCQEAWEFFGNEGRQVIGFAQKYFRAPERERFTATSENYPQEDLVFLGMSGIMDPPRAETAAAIRQCKEAGDSKESALDALAVADCHSDEAVVIGESLQSMSKEEWDVLLNHKYIVFARTNPDQKLLIVEECQKRGETVAVTGSGVNDAAALAKANIDIAMGLNGSDMAKQTADLILTDDNFASFVKGIEEGRLLFDNLRLSIAYTLAHLWPEVFPIILNFTLGMPLGLQPLQILSVDLGSELPPAVSLAYESPERDMMKVPPRDPKTSLVSKQLLLYSYILAGSFITCACFFAYMSVYWYHGITFASLLFTSENYFIPEAQNFTTPEGRVLTEDDQLFIRGQASAAWQITLVVAQIFHLYMCTTRRVSFLQHGITNLVSVFAVIIEMLLLNLFIYTPRVQDLMGTRAPPTHVWLFGPVIGIYLFVFNEVRKFFIRRFPRNRIVNVFKW
ncbi:Cation-ATPase-N domain-containing protein [Aphelenchoides fujianensis]|nr:Cation-ATPase-N domain-containing protein [Aphelenchoides fujianensis]